MKITRNKLKVVLIVSLCLLVCLGIYKTGIFRKKGTSDPVTLNVSLYKSLPHYDSFQTTVEECWNEKHPDVKLNFFDWYSESSRTGLNTWKRQRRTKTLCPL